MKYKVRVLTFQNERWDEDRSLSDEFDSDEQAQIYFAQWCSEKYSPELFEGEVMASGSTRNS